MGKHVFISYCHKQGEWVHDRLLPVVRAAGCAIEIDVERGLAGQGVLGQMDAWQDQAAVSLLVLTPDYLASEYCRHEMERAMAEASVLGAGPAALGAGLPTSPKGPTGGLPDSGDLSVATCAGSGDPRTTGDARTTGEARTAGVLPVLRQACEMSAFTARPDPLLWVDLTDDRQADPWALLLRSLDANDLRCEAPHWLDVRDELISKLRDQRQSVNLVVRGEPNWRALRDHLREKHLPRLAVVDLDDPATATLDGLVGQILKACGNHVSVPRGAASVAALNCLKANADVTFLAFCHFENVQARRKAYGVDLFFALRHLVVDERKLILLVESRVPFRELLPRDHPLSNLHLHAVELHGVGA